MIAFENGRITLTLIAGIYRMLVELNNEPQIIIGMTLPQRYRLISLIDCEQGGMAPVGSRYNMYHQFGSRNLLLEDIQSHCDYILRMNAIQRQRFITLLKNGGK